MWPPLKKLDLSDNALRYLPQQLVARWDWLEKLDLMNNKWSCDCNNQYLVSSGNHETHNPLPFVSRTFHPTNRSFLRCQLKIRGEKSVTCSIVDFWCHCRIKQENVNITCH